MTESEPKPTDIEDIQTILADLQEEIRRHRLALGELGAIERPDPLVKVRQHIWVNPHLPIGWPVMPKGIIPKIVAYAQKITRRLLRWYINPLVEQQNAYNAAVAEVLATLQGQVTSHDQRLAQVEGALQRESQGLEELRATLRGHGAQLRESRGAQEALLVRLEREREIVRLRLQRLENWYRTSTPAPAAALPEQPPTDTLQEPGADGFLLGALYRNEAQMRDRLSDYDDLFMPLAQAQRDGQGLVRPVLDIGCGRGEFVAHLKKLGLAAYGIDLDADAIEMGRSAGRDVRLADAFAHLATLADGSLAAITLVQVVEHLLPEGLLRLFRLAAQKLTPGGLIIAETLNPTCLLTLSNWFLLDPSHRTPLHPKTLQFLMEQAGLYRVQLRFLHPVPEEARLAAPPPGDAQRGTEALSEWLQRHIEQLNQFLYGPQDYAAIAYKPEE